MEEMVAVLNALSLLAPCEVPGLRKVRIGNPLRDGGYVIADRFRPNQKVYSYGISTDVSFDRALAERGLQLFMYDHTIPGLPEEHPNFHYFREGIGAEDQPGDKLFKLATHVKYNQHDDGDMILKIDVEGAEWDVFDMVDPQLLSRFDQIAMEVHDLDKLAEPGFRQRFVRGFTKLRALFNVIHVHGNNNVPVAALFGLAIPPVMELSLVRKDGGPVYPWRTVIPCALDVSNSPEPDYVLASFPFMPTVLTAEELKAGLVSAYRRAYSSPAERMPKLVTRGTNIAPLGRCSQSSLSPWSRGADEADRATRPGRTGEYAFHTGMEDGPWWQLDFGAVTGFDEIICFNRLDARADRADALVIERSDDGAQWSIIHANQFGFGGIDGRPLRVVCQGSSARFIRLRLPGYTALHLDGVEVYSWRAATGAVPSI